MPGKMRGGCGRKLRKATQNDEASGRRDVMGEFQRKVLPNN